MDTILIFVGLLVGCVGGWMLLAKAFRESVLWVMGCIFIPFVGLIFVLTHWSDTKHAFFINLAGVGLLMCGLYMGDSPQARAFKQVLSSSSGGALQSSTTPSVERTDANTAEDQATVPADVPVQSDSRFEELQGRPLNDLKSVLGNPKGAFKRGKTTIWMYDGADVISADGKTVTSIEVSGSRAANSGAAPTVQSAKPAPVVSGPHVADAKALSAQVNAQPSVAGDVPQDAADLSQDPKIAVPALIEQLGLPDPDLRMQAAIHLSEFRRDAKSAIPALEKALKDADPNVQDAAKIALQRIRWGIEHGVGRNGR